MRDRPASELPERVGGRPRSPGVTALVVLVILGWMFQVLPRRHARGQRRQRQGRLHVGPVHRHRHQRQGGRQRMDRGTTSPATRVAGEYYTEYHDVVATMERLGERPGPRVRPGLVGEQRGQRQVRHDDGVDAAAVLDRRLHRLDGGTVLRGVRHDAVPLPDHGGDVEAVVEPGPRAALREHTTSTVGVRAPAGPRRALRDGAHHRGQEPAAAESPELELVASSDPWEIYLVADSDLVVPLDRAAGRRQRRWRRPA